MASPASLNASDIQKLKTALNEAVAFMQRIQDEKEALNELFKELSKQYDITPKTIKTLANTMFKRNYSEIQEMNSELEFLYTSLIDG